MSSWYKKKNLIYIRNKNQITIQPSLGHISHKGISQKVRWEEHKNWGGREESCEMLSSRQDVAIVLMNSRQLW